MKNRESLGNGSTALLESYFLSHDEPRYGGEEWKFVYTGPMYGGVGEPTPWIPPYSP